MTSACPAGHTSTADDYCDVCGMPIESSSATAGSAPLPPPPPTDAPTQAPAGQLCPSCSTLNVADALFCEACGYDFTTGTMPRSAGPTSGAPGEPAPPAVDASASVAAQPEPGPQASAEGFGWVAEVWIDPAWYEAQESPDALPSAGLPSIVPLRKSSILIGRPSRSRNITPDIDCEPDTGTSRRQAQLTTDGRRWWVEDLDSSNGTYVGAASEPLPEDPIPVGPKRELDPDDRIYVGAWTRLVIREATEDERASIG
ncbi:MAG TPA: FHA domain-containing protein [Propionibacteriaceae bacterium]|nr:FHA domain-containing protein [Propionibacteriaceae bacterium]